MTKDRDRDRDRDREIRSKKLLLESLGRDEKLVAVGRRTGEVRGTETTIRLEGLRRRYKLGQAYQRVRNLEFRGVETLKLDRFDDYKGRILDKLKRPLNIKAVKRPSYPADEAYLDGRTRRHHPRGELLVIVENDVYDGVAAVVDRYVLDVGRDGYWATVHIIDGGTARELRTFIQSRRPAGVLLVGSVVVPWYDHEGDQFPCDLYYMDTNGTWTENASGVLTGHDGNLDPELWVGRLYTPTASGNDAALLRDYFDRNHRFRAGGLGHARSALAYVDDDWTGFDDCAFDEAFPASVITKYTNPLTTDADLYKAEVNSLRAWVQLCAHSWPQGHAFTVGSSGESIDTTYFRDVNPPNAHFYNLFCCGPGRFTDNDYLGGWYIFDQSGGGTNHGMCAVASAKTGSMLFFEDFYRPMGEGNAIGDAFAAWWRARGPEHEDWERYWFYGMTLLGDPTLNWWKGAVPAPQQPQPDDTFDHWPRKIQFRWDPVAVDGVTYTLEVDAHGAINAGQWAAETGQVFARYHGLTGTTHDHEFVGAQRGRWRVRAQVGTQVCAWSAWSYFRFTV